MKVTTVMAQRLCAYMNRMTADRCDLDEARDGLEVALADVPDPGDRLSREERRLVETVRRGWLDNAMLHIVDRLAPKPIPTDAQRQLRELEARLDLVREWALRCPIGVGEPFHGDHGGEVLAILGHDLPTLPSGNDQ